MQCKLDLRYLNNFHIFCLMSLSVKSFNELGIANKYRKTFLNRSLLIASFSELCIANKYRKTQLNRSHPYSQLWTCPSLSRVKTHISSVKTHKKESPERERLCEGERKGKQETAFRFLPLSFAEVVLVRGRDLGKSISVEHFQKYFLKESIPYKKFRVNAVLNFR